MGQITNPIVLLKGLRADFMKAYDATEPGLIMDAAMKVNSTARQEHYGWLGTAPEMQKFVDEKVPKGLLDFDYTLKNIPYEATLKVDKFDIQDDQIGGIKIRIGDLAQRAKMFPIKLLMALLVAGDTALCYDGQPFFSTSHSEGNSGTQSNLLTGSGVTLAALAVDFFAARAAMWNFKDDQGAPFNESDDLKLIVICPPALQGVFEQLMNATIIANTSNVLVGAAQVAISSRLTDTNDWYLLSLYGAVKPLVYQERNPVEFNALEQNSDEGFKKRFYNYGVEWYGTVGYGLWQRAIKTTN